VDADEKEREEDSIEELKRDEGLSSASRGTKNAQEVYVDSRKKRERMKFDGEKGLVGESKLNEKEESEVVASQFLSLPFSSSPLEEMAVTRFDRD